MPNVNVYDMSGKVVGDIALSDAVFGIVYLTDSVKKA